MDADLRATDSFGHTDLHRSPLGEVLSLREIESVNGAFLAHFWSKKVDASIPKTGLSSTNGVSP